LNIDITVRHADLPPALKDYALEKAQKLVRFYDRITSLHVIIDLESPQHVVEMEASVGRGVRLVAKDAHEDMYAAVDLVLDKLEGQVRKYKEKLSDHHRGERTQPAPGGEPATPEEPGA